MTNSQYNFREVRMVYENVQPYQRKGDIVKPETQKHILEQIKANFKTFGDGQLPEPINQTALPWRMSRRASQPASM